MSTLTFGEGSSKSFNAYPGGDFDLELGAPRKSRRNRNSVYDSLRMVKDPGNHLIALTAILFLFGIAIIVILSLASSDLNMSRSFHNRETDLGNSYPFPQLHNLVMVAGHSIYTSSSCGKVESEDSWFLEPYQRHQGQASTFLSHIGQGVKITAEDEGALLLFSGGETRKKAGPRSEAQSYWAVAESIGWFGEFLFDTIQFDFFVCFT